LSALPIFFEFVPDKKAGSKKVLKSAGGDFGLRRVTSIIHPPKAGGIRRYLEH